MTFPWLWSLADGYPAKGIKKHGSTVFSTFACGGGSSMGYKLAGYDVIGINEIDPKMVAIYKKNHSPKLIYENDIRDFHKSKLPKELFDLDILDGSPPCSSFSLSGDRDKGWGEKRKFKEGQKTQVLDDLFFEFIKTAERLKPKVIIAENVKGMLIGKARGYVVAIDEAFRKAGYEPQLFLLNAATMGVPQKRERVFFLCRRKDLKLPPIKLQFAEPQIPFGVISKMFKDEPHESIRSPLSMKYWRQTQPGQSYKSVHEKGQWYNHSRLSDRKVCSTIVSASAYFKFHSANPYTLTDHELSAVQTFPQDFDFCGQKAGYVVGMSVPPVMLAQIAHQVFLQWLK